MYRCEAVAVGPGSLEELYKYELTAHRYSSEIHDRMLDFIARHHMYEKFLDEDAAGER
jgi:hypothetical protein